MESKAQILNRLKHRSDWSFIEAEKDRLIKEYRASGHNRAEASDRAWQDISLKYPPVELFPSTEQPTNTEAKPPEFGDDGEFIAGALWAYSNLSRPITQADAPDDGAWALLVWARAFPNDFFKAIMPRVLELQAKFSISKDAAAEEELEESESMAELLEGVVCGAGQG